MEEKQLVIIGSGPAGYTAAIYAARAIINKPDVLLLDEPLAALDFKLRGRLENPMPSCTSISMIKTIYSAIAMELNGNKS